jgi:hypothetical protein
MFRGSVKSTGYPLHSPVSPSLPLPCVTVCHHISTGVYHRDIILCDMLHYSSIRSFCDMAGSTAIAAVPAYRKQGSTHTLFQCTVVNITFPITTVKNALEMVSFAQGTHQHMIDMFTAHLSAPVEYEECSLSGNDYSYVLYPFTSPTSKKSRHRFRAREWAQNALLILSLKQCFSTARPWPGTGPWEILLELPTNLNIILYLSTCHTVHISVLILFMIMP